MIQIFLNKNDIENIKLVCNQLREKEKLYIFTLGSILIGTIRICDTVVITYYENGLAAIHSDHEIFWCKQNRKTDDGSERNKFSSFIQAKEFILSTLPPECMYFVKCEIKE